MQFVIHTGKELLGKDGYGKKIVYVNCSGGVFEKNLESEVKGEYLRINLSEENQTLYLINAENIFTYEVQY